MPLNNWSRCFSVMPFWIICLTGTVCHHISWCNSNLGNLELAGWSSDGSLEWIVIYVCFGRHVYMRPNVNVHFIHKSDVIGKIDMLFFIIFECNEKVLSCSLNDCVYFIDRNASLCSTTYHAWVY